MKIKNKKTNYSKKSKYLALFIISTILVNQQVLPTYIKEEEFELKIEKNEESVNLTRKKIKKNTNNINKGYKRKINMI